MDPHHDEFDAVTARLEAGRPTLSALELDDLARRVQLRSKRTKNRKESFMRTRFAITSMLVVGVLLTSTAGVGMALSGNTGGGSAASAQYGPATTHRHHSQLGPVSTGCGSGSSGSSSGSSGSSHCCANQTAGSSSCSPAVSNTAPSDKAVQEPRQLATPSGSSQLPFTGLVLIPLIILGVAMLLVGIVLRTRSSRGPTV